MPESPVEPGRPESPARPNTHCFVCGPRNAFGLRLTFRLEEEENICRTTFVPDERHQGYDGWLHGGILGAVLDDVMANWYFLRGVKAVTGRMEVRYRSPVPIGDSLEFESWLADRKGPVARLQCKATNQSGEVVAEASGAYRIVEDGDGPAAEGGPIR